MKMTCPSPVSKVKIASTRKKTPTSPMLKRLGGRKTGTVTSQTATTTSSPRKLIFTKKSVKKLIVEWEEACPTKLTSAVKKPSL